MPAPITRVSALACSLVLAATLAALAPVVSFDFTNYDDPEYVVRNPRVTDGLTLAGVRWAATTNWMGNWHPLTWLSLMLDAELGGGSPAVFHATNLALHLLNTFLLFFLLNQLTGFPWRSAFVAALFAVHPLHVESVAWVAERKDVLSGTFFFLCLLAWAGYARKPGVWRYAAVVASLVLGLLSKPMLVSLPIVLLLLDYWPLERVTGNRGGRRLLLEKLPLLVPVAAVVTITVNAQIAAGAMSAPSRYPLYARVANAIVGYGTYLAKVFWPFGLIPHYPHPGTAVPVGKVAVSALVLLVITVFVSRTARSRPWWILGWAWYLVTLLPVIGLVQVGMQAIADRYTYLPLVGIFIAITWEAATLAARRGPTSSRAIFAAAVACIVVLAALTRVQAGHWRDGVALFEHAVSVDPANALTRHNLAGALSEKKRVDEAIVQWKEAIRIEPGFSAAHARLGIALLETGRLPESLAPLREAVRLDPRHAAAQHGLGAALLRSGDPQAAVAPLTEAIRLSPANAAAHVDLGVCLARLGRLDDAALHFAEALRIDPSNESARRNLTRARGGHSTNPM